MNKLPPVGVSLDSVKTLNKHFDEKLFYFQGLKSSFDWLKDDYNDFSKPDRLVDSNLRAVLATLRAITGSVRFAIGSIPFLGDDLHSLLEKAEGYSVKAIDEVQKIPKTRLGPDKADLFECFDLSELESHVINILGVTNEISDAIYAILGTSFKKLIYQSIGLGIGTFPIKQVSPHKADLQLLPSKSPRIRPRNGRKSSKRSRSETAL